MRTQCLAFGQCSKPIQWKVAFRLPPTATIYSTIKISNGWIDPMTMWMTHVLQPWPSPLHAANARNGYRNLSSTKSDNTAIVASSTSTEKERRRESDRRHRSMCISTNIISIPVPCTCVHCTNHPIPISPTNSIPNGIRKNKKAHYSSRYRNVSILSLNAPNKRRNGR